MARWVRHIVAASVALCLLLLTGVAYPQTVAHAAHHAHHHATTHGTALCAWLCAAGQAVDTTDLRFESERGPSAVLSSTDPEQHPLTVPWSSTSRGPPLPTA